MIKAVVVMAILLTPGAAGAKCRFDRVIVEVLVTKSGGGLHELASNLEGQVRVNTRQVLSSCGIGELTVSMNNIYPRRRVTTEAMSTMVVSLNLRWDGSAVGGFCGVTTDSEQEEFTYHKPILTYGTSVDDIVLGELYDCLATQ